MRWMRMPTAGDELRKAYTPMLFLPRCFLSDFGGGTKTPSDAPPPPPTLLAWRSICSRRCTGDPSQTSTT